MGLVTPEALLPTEVTFTYYLSLCLKYMSGCANNEVEIEPMCEEVVQSAIRQYSGGEGLGNILKAISREIELLSVKRSDVDVDKEISRDQLGDIKRAFLFQSLGFWVLQKDSTNFSPEVMALLLPRVISYRTDATSLAATSTLLHVLSVWPNAILTTSENIEMINRCLKTSGDEWADHDPERKNTPSWLISENAPQLIVGLANLLAQALNTPTAAPSLRVTTAQCYSQLFNQCNADILKSSLLKVAAPMLRHALDRTNEGVRIQLLGAMTNLLKMFSVDESFKVHLRGIIPQIFTSLTRSLQDPTSVSVRDTAGRALSIFVENFNYRVEALITDFLKVLTVSKDRNVRSSVLKALMGVMKTKPQSEKISSAHEERVWKGFETLLFDSPEMSGYQHDSEELILQALQSCVDIHINTSNFFLPILDEILAGDISPKRLRGAAFVVRALAGSRHVADESTTVAEKQGECVTYLLSSQDPIAQEQAYQALLKTGRNDFKKIEGELPLIIHGLSKALDKIEIDRQSYISVAIYSLECLVLAHESLSGLPADLKKLLLNTAIRGIKTREAGVLIRAERIVLALNNGSDGVSAESIKLLSSKDGEYLKNYWQSVLTRIDTKHRCLSGSN